MTMNKRICLYCGKDIINKNNIKFCDNQCHASYEHIKKYRDFIENNDKYCYGSYTPKNFKDFFLEEQQNKCAIYGCEPIHNGKPLVFVLDHIDGDAANNKRDNLRLICPNCDSQLETFKSKNKKSSRRNYWKEKIMREI